MEPDDLDAMVNEIKIKSIKSEEAKKFQTKTQILLVTANKQEYYATLTLLKPMEDDVLLRYQHSYNKDINAIYTFGKFGAFKAAVQKMETQESTSAQDVVIKVAADFFGDNLHAIFAVGVAYGVEDKNDLLDVLVSDEITG